MQTADHWLIRGKKWIVSALKAGYDSFNNDHLKKSVLFALPFWVGAILTGLVAAGYAKLFAIAEELGSSVYHINKYFVFIMMPAAFLLAWWLVKKFAPYARGSGIPQVMAALELASSRQREKVSVFLSIRIVIIKILSSIVMAVGGAVIGREGPTIQVSGSIFRTINNLLPEWWPKISRKNMIMAGAAAGLAAAFNTPLGGIVFAVEELSKTHINNFKSAVFISVIIAGLTARAILGTYLYLGFPQLGPVTFRLFAAILVVASVAGWAGGIFCKYLFRLMMAVRKLTAGKQVAYIVAAALVLASMAILSDKVAGSGKNLITQLLFSADKSCALGIPVGKMFGSMISFSFGAAGGVFAPSLSIGAGIGAVLSGAFHFFAADANLLILAGMVAFLTGVTRSPFTCAILVLEMTGGHNNIFHLMVAAVVAAGIAFMVDRESFYERLMHVYVTDVKNKPEESKDVD